MIVRCHGSYAHTYTPMTGTHVNTSNNKTRAPIEMGCLAMAAFKACSESGTTSV